MDLFHILSRGAQFNKRKFGKDVARFATSSAPNAPSDAPEQPDSLPSDLDFFKYASRAGPSKQQSKQPESSDEPQQKRRKTEPGTPHAKHRIVAKGRDVPAQLDSFQAMCDTYHFSKRLVANLEEHGFHSPMSIQAQGCPVLLSDRDLYAVSPTGTGKTLSYMLPIFAKLVAPVASGDDRLGSATGPRALIIVPTNELAQQIYNEGLKLATGRKWKVVLFSKATASTLADKAARSKTDIIIGTPLRLVNALHSGNLELGGIRHLVLDEADRLLDSEFVTQTSELMASCTYSQLQRAVLSATFPASVEKIAMDFLRDPVRVIVGTKDTPLPSVSQQLVYVNSDSSKLPTLTSYLTASYDPPILIFVSTQARAASLAEQLVLHGIKHVDSLHAGLTNQQRKDVMHRIRAGESWVIVTTDVMARGLDFKGLRGVINYDFPTSVQSYIHRIGRTGRAGNEGTALTYFTNDDAPYLKPIANVMMQSGSTVPDWVAKLPKPSKMKRRLMGKTARPDRVNGATSVGRVQANRRKQMILATKKRREDEESNSI